jgi:magnesium transporter
VETEQLLAQAFLAAHPEDAARILERLPPPAAAALLEDTPPSVAAAVLKRMGPLSGAEYLACIVAELVGPIMAALPLDTAATLLRRLDLPAREQILTCVLPKVSAPLRLLLQYPEGTAGALMDPQVLALPEDISVEEALEHVRRASQHAFYYLYVVNRAHLLVGVLNLRELMLAPQQAPLTTVMRLHVARLSARADRTTIVAHPAWRDFHALPVVDDVGTFLGALRYEIIRRLEGESATNRQTQSALATLFTLGELYWIGLSQVFAGLVSALAPQPTRQESDRRANHGA